MKKIGKTNKYLSSDLFRFANDPIRSILCDQEPIILNSKLKNNIKVVEHKEQFVPSSNGESGYYRGQITLKAPRNIADSLRDLIQTSKVVKKTIQNPEFLKLRKSIFKNLESVGAEAQTSLLSEIFKITGGLRVGSRLVDLIDIPKSSSSKKDIKKIDALAKKFGFVSLEKLQQDLVEIDKRENITEKMQNIFSPDGKKSKFVPSSIENIEYINSAFFNKPVLDVIFTEEKHYEQKKDILNYRPPPNFTANPTLDLRSVDNILTFKVSLEYNFLVKKYEDFIKAYPNIPVWNLPYFYEILEFKNNVGNIPELSDYDGIKGNFAFKGSDQKDTSFYNRPEMIINVSTPRREMEKLVINSKMGLNRGLISIDKYLKKFNSYKEQFPMYAEIKFDVHEKPPSNISDLFHEYNLYSKILNEIKLDTTATDLLVRKPLTELSIEELRRKALNNDSLKRSSIEGYLLNEKFIEQLFNPSDPSKAIINDPTIFFKFNSKAANLKRNFNQILNGDECYNEVIGYTIQKFEKNSSTLLQEWFLPNISEDYLEWIDTQVKYGEEYTYKLNILSLTVATVYQYSNWSNLRDDAVQINGDQIKIFYTHKPQFLIYTLPESATYNNILLDKPPVPPDLEIIPYINIDNRIKININTGIGKFEDVPVAFNSNEEQINNLLKKAQDRIDNKIIYESDEPSEYFEIYRTDFLPTNYKEMLQGKLVKIETKGSTAASYEDIIEANKKYYYMARSIDSHKKTSNPTKIFQVELVNENGAIYPITKVAEFGKKEELKEDHRTFRKYMKVFPAMIQKIVHDPNTTKDNFKLGPTTDAVWNKNMKITLVSKQTGRKIDLNFKFKYDIKR